MLEMREHRSSDVLPTASLDACVDGHRATPCVTPLGDGPSGHLADSIPQHWEKRNSDIALFEINQEFESQRLQLQQANQWADQSQRDNVVWRIGNEK